jgi:hypothetical protein
MVLAISVCLLAAAFGVFTWWALVQRRLTAGNWLGSTVVIVWLAASGLKLYDDRTSTDDGIDRALRTAAAASWGTNVEPAPPQSSRASAASTMTSVGSVDSLIGGLEAKLAEHPDDAKGWALLAQSYSFTGDAERTEQAIARAVELGFEESELRARVSHATRATPPHPVVPRNGG